MDALLIEFGLKSGSRATSIDPRGEARTTKVYQLGV